MVSASGLGRGWTWLVDAFHDGYMVPYVARKGKASHLYFLDLFFWRLILTSLSQWSGLAVALGTVYVLYILPRTLAPWRDVIGVPGV